MHPHNCDFYGSAYFSRACCNIHSVVWKMKEGMMFVASVMRDVFKQQKVHHVHLITLENLGEMAFNREKSV